MISYSIPQGVQLTFDRGRPLLSTLQGGKVALDDELASLWKRADGRTLQDVLDIYRGEAVKPTAVQAGLACLVEAGLLLRAGDTPPVVPTQVQETHGPLVSAIIVGYNSREWLQECIPSLQEQTYSLLEIIFVDNGSQDDSSAWLTRSHPFINTLRIETPVSLASAINQGVSRAGGEYFLLLNPDLRLESDAVAQMMAVMQADPNCAAVAAKLRFWWARAFLNGLGNRVGPFSWGTDNALGHLDLGQFDQWKELPSACFAAAILSKSVWQVVGDIDEGFPMFYEDTEWSYRARSLGYSIQAAPQALIYHALGARVPRGGSERLSPPKIRNVVYGRLRFITKIVPDAYFRFLVSYMIHDLLHLCYNLLTLRWQSAGAIVSAWQKFIKDLPELRRERHSLAGKRTIGSAELFSLQQDMPATLIWHALPELTMDLVTNTYLPLILERKTRPMPEFAASQLQPHLLIISNDIIAEKMAGPGIRYLEMARALSESIRVTLAVPVETKLEVPGLQFEAYSREHPGSLQEMVRGADVVLVSGDMLEKYPFIQTANAHLVVDLYDPTVLENLHTYAAEPLDNQQAMNQHGVELTNLLLRHGDFFICGNERQRDFWLGCLAANGRVNPLNFKRDPGLRKLIDQVGVGFPDREPKHYRPVVRAVHPQVPAESRIVLWGGGIWDWLDPLTLIKAWPQVLSAHPAARLVFLGTRHPNPLVPQHEMAQKAVKLAQELGELDRTILFFEWLSFEDREALLCEADVGVAIHPVHVETRYSIRTRVLDYFWARLPVLVTEGDITSQWVREQGLGKVVPHFDEQAVASALVSILDCPKAEWSPAFEPLVDQHRWSRVVEPLRRFCLEGQVAPDRELIRAGSSPNSAGVGWRWRWSRARYILRKEGPRALVHRIWRYTQWRLSQPSKARK
jgi:GT2 family glycosyltransferase